MPQQSNMLTQCRRCSFPIWPAKDWQEWERAAERHLQQIPWDCYEMLECRTHGSTMHTVRWRYHERLTRFKQRVTCVACARSIEERYRDRRLGVDTSNTAG